MSQTLASQGNLSFTLLEDETSDNKMTFTPVESAGMEPANQKIRPSNPIKQGIAGLTDIATSIPALPGLVIAGGEAAYKMLTDDTPKQTQVVNGIETLTGKDKGFTDYFAEAASDGVDSSLLRASNTARQFVNKQLGIKDPVSTEDQLARILGSSFIPVPGAFATSKLGSALTYLTPLVRVGGPKLAGLGTVGRMGVEAATNAVTDQGANYLLDRPLAFSPEAIVGTTPERYQELTSEPEAMKFTPLETPTVSPEEARLLELDAKLDSEERKNNALITGGVIGAALLGYAGRKKLASMARNATVPNQDLSKTVSNVLSDTHSSLVDSRTAVSRALRESGWSNDVADINNQLDTTLNSLGIAQQFIRDGVARVTGKKVGTIKINDVPVTASLANLRIKVQSLGPVQQKIFNEGMKAKSDLANIERTRKMLAREGRLNEYVPEKMVTLINPRTGQRYRYNELVAAASAIDNNTELTTIAQRLRENMNAVLDDGVRLGVLDHATVQKWRDDFSFNGNDVYMPFYNKPDDKTLAQRLRNKLWTKEQATDAAEMGRWEARALSTKASAREVLDPIQAAERYIGETIDHVNRNASGFNLLRRLAHRGFDRSNNSYPMIARGTGPGFIDGEQTAVMVGSRKTEADSWEFDDWFNQRAQRAGTMESNTLKEFSNNSQNIGGHPNVITVRHNGMEHAFYVPNKLIRDTVKYRPQLHGVYAFSQFWKDLFVQGTTGNLSFFAPVSNIYGTMQIAFNASAQSGRGMLKEIPSAMYDSVRGTYALAANRISKQLADTLALRLETHTGLAKLNPQMAENLRKTFNDAFESSILNPVIRESGAFKTSVGTTDVMKLVEDQLPIIGKGAWKNFPRQTWHMWKHLNEALREGPAVGRALREGNINDNSLFHLGRESNDSLREGARKAVRAGTRIARDYGGDFSRVGSSKTAKFINAAFPFSGAMIQSWNSIGTSIMKHPKESMAALTGLIGIPTATELAWNDALDSAYPEMGYSKHYWNTLTTDQRIANHVFYLPGLSPDRAILVPVMPEFSLGKAVVLESLDAIFAFSARGSAASAPSGTLKENGDNLVRAYQRVLDIPVPPLASAAASAAGYKFSVGPERSIDNDAFSAASPFNLRPSVPGGQRYGGSGDKYTDDVMGEKVTNILQDVFGAMGGTYAQIANSFSGQVKQTLKADGGAGDAALAGMNAGMEQIIESSRKMSGRIPGAQTLFGKALSPNPNNEINEEVLRKTNAMTKMRDELKLLEQSGVPTNSPFAGNAGSPTEDPVFAFAATTAQSVMAEVGKLNPRIAQLRKEITSLGNATQQFDGKLLPSVNARHEEIDQRKLEISGLKAQQVAIIRFYEEQISQWMIANGYETDPNYKFSYDTITSRSRGGGLISRPPQ